MNAVDLKQVLVGIGATVLLFGAGQTLGPLGTFGFMACPVPLLYLMLGRLRFSAGIVGAGSGLTILGLMGPVIALQYLGIFALAPVLLGVSLTRGKTWDRALAGSTLIVFTVMVIAGVLSASLQGQSLTGYIDQLVAAEIAQARQAYEVMALEPEQLLQLQEVSEQVALWLPKLFPAFFVFGIGMVNMISLSLARRLPGAPSRIPGPAFTAWKAPEKLVWGLIAAGFTVMLPGGWWTAAALNLLILIVPIYFLQGMAIIASLMRKKGLPKAFRVMVYCTVVLINPLPVLVAGVGLFDIWADFRRPRVAND